MLFITDGINPTADRLRQRFLLFFDRLQPAPDSKQGMVQIKILNRPEHERKIRRSCNKLREQEGAFQ
jgi:hypothetical protein